MLRLLRHEEQAVAKRRRYTEKQIEKAYASLFSSPGGQIVFWDLSDKYLHTTTVDMEFNTNGTFFREGRRALVLEIFEKAKLGEEDEHTISASGERAAATTSSEFNPTGVDSGESTE